MKLNFPLLLGVVLTFGLNTASFAGPITYTTIITGSGSLGGTAFTDAAVTFTTVSDTSSINYFPFGLLPFYTNPGVTTVDIAGLGSATFITDVFGAISVDISSLAGPGVIFLGMGDITTQLAVGGIITNAPPYDLSSPLAIGGAGRADVNYEFLTNVGDFVFTDVTGIGAFTAIAEVPEPSTLTLSTIGLVSMGGLAWRKRRQAA